MKISSQILLAVISGSLPATQAAFAPPAYRQPQAPTARPWDSPLVNEASLPSISPWNYYSEMKYEPTLATTFTRESAPVASQASVAVVHHQELQPLRRLRKFKVVAPLTKAAPIHAIFGTVEHDEIKVEQDAAMLAIVDNIQFQQPTTTAVTTSTKASNSKSLPTMTTTMDPEFDLAVFVLPLLLNDASFSEPADGVKETGDYIVVANDDDDMDASVMQFVELLVEQLHDMPFLHRLCFCLTVVYAVCCGLQSLFALYWSDESATDEDDNVHEIYDENDGIPIFDGDYGELLAKMSANGTKQDEKRSDATFSAHPAAASIDSDSEDDMEGASESVASNSKMISSQSNGLWFGDASSCGLVFPSDTDSSPVPNQVPMETSYSGNMFSTTTSTSTSSLWFGDSSSCGLVFPTTSTKTMSSFGTTKLSAADKLAQFRAHQDRTTLLRMIRIRAKPPTTNHEAKAMGSPFFCPYPRELRRTEKTLWTAPATNVEALMVGSDVYYPYADAPCRSEPVRATTNKEALQIKSRVYYPYADEPSRTEKTRPTTPEEASWMKSSRVYYNANGFVPYVEDENEPTLKELQATLAYLNAGTRGLTSLGFAIEECVLDRFRRKLASL